MSQGTSRVCDTCRKSKSFYTLGGLRVECSDCEKNRLYHIGLRALKNGDKICGLHKLDEKHRKLAIEFHGRMIQEAWGNFKVA